MESYYYLATTLWTSVVNAAFLLATLWLLKKGGASPLLQSLFGVISALWLIFIYYSIGDQQFIAKQISGATFYIFTLLAAGVVLIFFHFSSLKKIFENIPQQDIQWVQGMRVFVAAGFLTEGVVEVIPGWFSIMDGFLHVTSGFLALIAAIAVLKNQSNQHQMLWLANIVGILDIVIIVTGINFIVWEEIGPFHNMQAVVFYTGVLLLWFHLVSVTKLLYSSKKLIITLN